MAIAGLNLGIDLGSANTAVCLPGQGVALREASYVLTLEQNENEVLAIGDDAKALLGRTDEEAALIAPILDGAVADIDLAAMLASALAEKALSRRRALEKARAATAISPGATKVERAALLRAMVLTGARRTLVVKSPVAAAVGAGVEFHEPHGVMQIVLGGSTTEISVLSLNGIVAARSMRTGGNAMDEAVVRYLRREKGIVIGVRTAEDLKMDLGSATEPEEDTTVRVKGRSVHTGRPETIEITNRDIYLALRAPVELLVDAIKDALANTPAELAGDLMDKGIHLSGGGALLSGLNQLLHEATQLPVITSDLPQDDVAMGLARISAEERVIARLAATGALVEG